jgi:hypothetical protein
MAGIHKVTSQVIDYAERVSAMADAAQGRHRRPAGKTSWLLLPASGAAMYALLRNDRFSRQAKGVLEDAKTRASELPEDLIALVRETVDGSSTPTGGQARRQTSAPRKRSSSRSKASTRKTTPRKAASASR